MVRSVNHPDRYPLGAVRFTETQFLGRSMARLIRTDHHPDNHAVSAIAGLDPAIRDKIAAIAPRVSRGRLLKMSAEEQGDRFGLSEDETRQLRRATLGLEGPELDPRRRWDRPRQVLGDRSLPNLIGLSLDQARARLQGEALGLGEVTWRDSETARGTVLSQYPQPGVRIRAGSDADLVVSTGASVPIPQVVGVSLTQALVMLREAGLETEPQIMFAANDQSPRNYVLAVTPPAGQLVTPGADVVLEVSSGNQ
jgi:hypothetical protein